MPAAKKLGSGRHLSAFKRQRQTKKRTLRNRSAKSKLRTSVKNARTLKTAAAVKQSTVAIDKMASKGVIPKRRASRLVSRLTRMLGAAQ